MKPNGNASNVGRPWVAAIILLGIILRFVGLGAKPLWEDEGWTFHAATAPEGLIAVAGLDPHPLSFYALYRALPAWFLETDWRFRLPSAIFSCGALLLFAALLRLARVETRLALCSVALFAVLPLNLRYAHEARAYAAAQMLAVAVPATYVWSLRSSKPVAMIALLIATALSAHLDGFGLAAPCAVFLHAMIHRRNERRALYAAGCIGAGALLAIPYYVFRIRAMGGGEVHEIEPPANLLNSLASRLVELSPFGIGFDHVGAGQKWLVFVLAAIVLVVLLLGATSRRAWWSGHTRRLFVLLIVVAPAAYVALSIALGPNLIHKKYLIVIVPGLVPIFAAGVMRLTNGRRLPMWAAMFGLPLAVSGQMLISPGERADWRSLFQQMQPEIQAGDGFIQEMQANYPLYSFASFQAYAYRDGIRLHRSQLLEYRPKSAGKTFSPPDVETEGVAIGDFVQSFDSGRVWTLSADWMARGRSLDLSTLATLRKTISARGVSATQWATESRP
ncbi:MAG TPA: hypothetical protein VNT79_16150 [Phycisphaerae bacterium]|nr:hypothetical protein [Phycisphaerae bacterium]